MVEKTILPKVSPYSTLYLEGKVTVSPKGDSRELHVTKLLFHGVFPGEMIKISHKMSDSLLRAQVSQRLLTKCYQLIMSVRDDISLQLQIISKALGMMRVFSPFITFSDCEGGGETFEVMSSIEGFFKKPAYLTVSGQVDEETGTARMLCPTYILGPSFRSDPSQTRFHACEFWHYEPEIPIPPSHLDQPLSYLMDLEETIISKMLKFILETPEVSAKVKFLHSKFKKLEVSIDQMKEFSSQPFARVTYTEAIKILIKESTKDPELFKIKPSWGMDMHKEHERYLCEKYFKKPTFETNFSYTHTYNELRT